MSATMRTFEERERSRLRAYGLANGTWDETPGHRRRVVRLTPRQRRRYFHKRNAELARTRRAVA